MVKRELTSEQAKEIASLIKRAAAADQTIKRTALEKRLRPEIKR
jgi:hypothetical protein